jgi:hypothetical protein
MTPERLAQIKGQARYGNGSFAGISEREFEELVEGFEKCKLQVRAYKEVVKAALALDAATRSEEGDGRTWSKEGERAADVLFAALKEVRASEKQPPECTCSIDGTPYCKAKGTGYCKAEKTSRE